MKAAELTSRLLLEAQHCPMRQMCPLAFLCASQQGEHKYILPNISNVNVGEMVWTDLSARRRMFVVRSGVLLNKVYGNNETEIPQTIFGPGSVAGVPDVFVSYIASDFYYFVGLTPSQLCSFDGDFFKERLADAGPEIAQQITARIALNQTTSIYGQTLTLAHRRVREKVVSVLMRLDLALSRQPGYEGELPITHDDIAFIACTERATASRELKKLARDKLIDIEYRRVTVLPALRERYGTMIEANLPFYKSDGDEPLT